MNPPTILLSDEDVIQRFNELVNLCRQLKDEGRLYSGYNFELTADGKTGASSLPVGSGTPEEMLQAMYEALRLYQQTRHMLTQQFDMTAAAWNASPAGKMLNTVEKTFRDQAVRFEDEIRKGLQRQYNAFTISFFAAEIASFVSLVTSPEFSQKRPGQKWSAMNEHAKDFFKRRRRMNTLQIMSANVEATLALNEVRLIRGDTDLLESMRRIIQTGVYGLYKSYFKV